MAHAEVLVDDCYYGDQDRAQYRHMIGLPGHGPSLLVMGGGTLGEMEDFFVKVIRQLKCAATVYIVGVERRLRNLSSNCLIRNQAPGPLTARLLGYTDARPYFRAVDAVLTKPGVSVAEALAVGIPTILAFPVPGHDELALEELLAVRAGRLPSRHRPSRFP